MKGGEGEKENAVYIYIYPRGVAKSWTGGNNRDGVKGVRDKGVGSSI